MPAYSFHERFVPFVKDGSKNNTIRSRRKYPAKIGDRVYLYQAQRTKQSKKIKEDTCSYTTTVAITAEGNILIFSKRLDIVPNTLKELYSNKLIVLNNYQADLFAWRDGFRPDGSIEKNPAGCFDLMFRWFRKMHELPFIGDIIFWNNKRIDIKF